LSVRNIRLTIEYDGTSFSGWQKQPEVPTIQGTLEERLAKLAGHPVDLLVAGRTDAGVHALGQVANFRTRSRLKPLKIKEVLNQMLPHSIRVAAAKEVPLHFHATFHARAKLYRYVLRNTGDYTVFDRCFYHQVRTPLDLSAMRRAASFLEGTHDFSAFRGTLGKRANPRRTLMKITVKKHGPNIVLDYLGESFLHQMVRILSGTLIYAGLGKIKPEDMRSILKSKDRRKAGPTLPHTGLFLVRVFYPKVFPPVRNKTWKALE